MQDLECTKKNKYKKVLATVFTLLLVLIFTGCTTVDSFRATFISKKTNLDEDVIYIGVFESQTGDQSEKGLEEINGIELANKMYHQVKGKEVMLVKVDSQSSTSAAKTAISALIEAKPVAIIGNSGEAASLAAAPMILKAKIPTITPSAKNLLITEDNDYYFRACITDSQIGEGAAEYAWNKVGARKFASIRISGDSTAESINRGFIKKLAELNDGTKPVVLDTELKINQKSYKKVVSDIKKSAAKAVFMPVGKEAADAIFKEVEKQKLTDITFLGSNSWSENDFLKMMKKHPKINVAFPTDNTISSNGTTSNTITPETQKFIIEYHNMFGSDAIPTENAAQGYDSYLLIMNAINRSPSLKSKDIMKTLASTQGYRCATGVFTFNDEGNPIRTVNIAIIKNGELVPAYTTTSDTNASGMIKITTNKN